MVRGKVLVIEDDPVAVKSLQNVISKEGFSVVTASNGSEGLELFKSESPEIVITDLKMPEIDGLEILYTVKHTSPMTQVILITAHGDYDTAILALRQGALDYIKKPIQKEILLFEQHRGFQELQHQL